MPPETYPDEHDWHVPDVPAVSRAATVMVCIVACAIGAGIMGLIELLKHT